jgi:glycosyltransferase involved in cell wall biosynthesis
VFFIWACWKTIRISFNVLHLNSTGAVGPVSAAVTAWILTLIAGLRGACSLAVHSLADSDDCTFVSTGWNGFWRKMFFRSFDQIIAVGPALYQGLSPHFPAKVKMIPCGIRDDIFQHCPDSRTALRADKQIGSGDLVFAFLGSVGRRKGFDVLANAFSELAPTHPGWRLWVVGPRSRRESPNTNEREVAEVTSPLKDVQNQVKFWGRLDDRYMLNRILSASDVFVFPSRREGMGIAPLEAMAAGVPVVVSRIPGVTDLANLEGDTGLYVPPGDLPSLKAAMLRLGTDQALRKTMGARAAQVVREGFAWEQHMTKWMKLYGGGPAAERALKEPARHLTLKS